MEMDASGGACHETERCRTHSTDIRGRPRRVYAVGQQIPERGFTRLYGEKSAIFHIAQEITQDAFLKAYQKLGTLKSYELFGGWLYVIASNLCLDWLRKNPLPEQSLEVTDASEVNQVSYSRYITGQQAAEADEARREVVKKLLQKLPESERTVMTLHYLGEMTIKDH